MTKRQTAPRHLRPKTRAWVRSVLQSWELEDHHVRLLILAGEALDRAEAAREVIEKDGATFLDRFKQPSPSLPS